MPDKPLNHAVIGNMIAEGVIDHKTGARILLWDAGMSIDAINDLLVSPSPTSGMAMEALAKGVSLPRSQDTQRRSYRDAITGRTVLAATVQAPQATQKPAKLVRGRNNHRWQPEELATVRNLFAMGTSYDEIARVMQRSVKAIVGAAYQMRKREGYVPGEENRPSGRLGPKHRQWTRQEEEFLRDEFMAGTLLADIAQVLERTDKAVHVRMELLKANGFIPPNASIV